MHFNNTSVQVDNCILDPCSEKLIEKPYADKNLTTVDTIKQAQEKESPKSSSMHEAEYRSAILCNGVDYLVGNVIYAAILKMNV